MWFRRKKTSEDHESVGERLDKQEDNLHEMAKRVRVLEIEAGIYRPKLKEANGK